MTTSAEPRVHLTDAAAEKLSEIIEQHPNPVAGGQTHPLLPHLSANGGKDKVLVVQLDAKHGAGKDHGDAPFDFDMMFFHLENSVLDSMEPMLPG